MIGVWQEEQSDDRCVCGRRDSQMIGVCVAGGTVR